MAARPLPTLSHSPSAPPLFSCPLPLQIVGAILGSAFLYATIPNSSESPLGSNRIAPGVGYGNALCGEIVMTWVLGESCY